MKMKGLFKCLTMLALVLCLLPVRAEAASASSNGFTFAISSGVCTDHETQNVSALTATAGVSEGKLSVSYVCGLECGDPLTGSASCDFDCNTAYSGQAIGPLTFSRAAGHSVSSWTPVEGGGHQGTCGLCGETVKEGCSGGNANCTTAGTCTKCGSSYLLPDNHAYSWKNDENGHWQECAHNAAHKIQEGTCAAGTKATCVSKAICGTCGLEFGSEDVTAHAWSGWTHGEVDANHTRTCTLDSTHTETKTHEFDYAVAVDDAGHLYGTCEICGYSVDARLVPDTSKSTVYNGSAITPLKIQYSGTWIGEKTADTAITYANNVNAGDATGTVTIAGKQLTRTFTITQAPLTITDITAQSRAYDGTANVTITNLEFSGNVGEDDVDIALPVATVESAAVGTYDTVTLPANDQLVLTGADKGNYAVTSASAFSEAVTISPKEITVTITAPDSVYGKVTEPTAVFNGLLEQDKDCAAVTYEGTTEKVVDGEKVKYEAAAAPAVAGTYTVKTAVDSSNYKLTGTTTANFKIAKAPADYDAPKAIKLAYNGKDQELVTAGVIRGNKNSFQYKKEKDTTWGSTIPTAKNAGTDVILWQYEEDENHLGASGKVEVAIEPAILTVTPDADQKSTYGAARKKLTYTVKGAIITEVPLFTGDLAMYGKDAGTYEIKIGSLKLTDNGTFKKANYQIKLEKVKYVINPAYVVLTAEDQIITCGASIDSKKYTITDTAYDDVATVTLKPSTTGVTYGGTIMPSAVIKNEDGEDVSRNYYVAAIAGKLVIEPDYAVVEGVSSENVNHTQEEAIKALQESLNKADTEKATDAQKKRIEEAKAQCAALLEQIEKSSKAMETDAIKDTADIKAENVKLDDEKTVKQAISDIEKAKVDYAKNYSAEDMKKLDDQLAQLKGALETIENAVAVIDLLDALPATAKAEDASAAEVRAAFKELTDYEKELVLASDSGKLIEAVSYKILSGDSSVWEKGKNLTFTVDGDYARFIGIKVDGKAVDQKFYEAQAGSTVVTLNKGYLKKVNTKADHTIQFLFDDGDVDGTFHISADAIGGGFAFLGTLIWMIVLAAAAGAAYLFIRKKKNG